MKPIKSKEDLGKLKQEAKAKVELKTGNIKARVFVEMGSSGIAVGAREVFESIVDHIKTKGIQNVEVVATGGRGCCAYEPVVRIKKKGVAEETCFSNVSPSDVDKIIGALT